MGGAAAIVAASVYEEEVRGEEAAFEAAGTIGAESHAEVTSYLPPHPGYRGALAAHVEMIRRGAKSVSVPLIASLNGITREGWTDIAAVLQEAGAAALELNLFHIPTDPLETSAEAEDRLVQTVREVCSSVTIPVAVKLSPNFTAPANLALALAGAGAKGIVLFGRCYEPNIRRAGRSMSGVEINEPVAFEPPVVTGAKERDLAEGLTWDNADSAGDAAGQLTTCQEVVESPPASPFADPLAAVDCRDLSVSSVEAYVQAGVSPATRRAYRADLDHFEAWGGTFPAADAQIAAYIAEHATVLKVATLTRRLAAISIAHDARDLPNPVRSALVRATMRGIRRAHGAGQRQAKPLLRGDLFFVLGAMGDRPKDLRDRALLLIGFAGGLRRSELSAINCRDIEQVQQGIILTIPRSKPDQEGVGRKIGIPFGRTIHCPVRALDAWLAAAQIEDGPVFRLVDRHGRVSVGRLSGEAVSLIVQERLAAPGFDPTGYSGHSLRAGFATSATRAGVLTFKIRQQTGHASDAMLSRYVRDGGLGGRYGNRPGLHRLWDHPQEVDLQKPVLQTRARDLDMIGELEVAFEIPLGNALVD